VMIGLDQRTVLLSLTAVVLSGWCVYEIYTALAKILSVLAMPFSWLKFPSTKTEADPDEARREVEVIAFEYIQFLRDYAKKANCEVMEFHLSQAGKCLFDHDHEVHPPAPEVVA
jgi:hypothetical protein